MECAWQDSNPQQPDPQSGALPIELQTQDDRHLTDPGDLLVDPALRCSPTGSEVHSRCEIVVSPRFELGYSSFGGWRLIHLVQKTKMKGRRLNSLGVINLRSLGWPAQQASLMRSLEEHPTLVQTIIFVFQSPETKQPRFLWEEPGLPG